jgi:hypothetical protein
MLWGRDLAGRAGGDGAFILGQLQDAGEPGRISTPPGALFRAPLVSSRSHPRGSLLGTSRPKEVGHPVDTRPTLLKVLLTERHWQRYETFRAGRSISAG